MIEMVRRTLILVGIFMIVAIAWGPALYFGTSATTKAYRLADGKEFCWFVKKPYEKKPFGYHTDWPGMILTLDPGAPYDFWTIPADWGTIHTRLHFGIVIPGNHYRYRHYAWSYYEDNFWHMEDSKAELLGMAWFPEECTELLETEKRNAGG